MTLNETLWFTVRIAAVSYVGLAALLYFRQSKYVYYPQKGLTVTPRTAGLAHEDVAVRTADGETVHGWFVPAATPDRPTVLVCHGNAGNISGRLDLVWLLHDLDVNVCMFDYRGYGNSTGHPTEEGTYRDADAVWTWLTGTRGIPADRIVLLGESLGGAVAAELAERRRPAGLILESTFTSLPDMAAHIYPYLPVRWLCRFRYDTLERLPRIACPVLVMHGRDDEMIPYAQGRRLFERAREPKWFCELGGSHNTGREASAKAYEAAVRAFIDEVNPSRRR